MERRKIVAAIVEIANQLDEMGMYAEANQLTKVAQTAGEQAARGLRDLGVGTMRGIKGFGRDLSKGLKGTYDAAKQGVSDVGEVLDSVGGEYGYGVGRDKREFEMGYAPTSNESINRKIEVLKTQIQQGNKSGITFTAQTINALIEEKIQTIMSQPGAQTTSAKNEIVALRQKQFEVRKLRDSFKPGSGSTTGRRSDEGQFNTPVPEIIAFIDNRARKTNLTKAQIFEMAVAERGPEFANDVAAHLTSQGFQRDQIVKPYVMKKTNL